MTEVSKRDFARNVYDYLKPGEYVVTNHGRAEYVVTVREVDDVVTVEGLDELRVKVQERYGCGCLRRINEVLCREHGRY